MYGLYVNTRRSAFCAVCGCSARAAGCTAVDADSVPPGAAPPRRLEPDHGRESWLPGLLLLLVLVPLHLSASASAFLCIPLLYLLILLPLPLLLFLFFLLLLLPLLLLLLLLLFCCYYLPLLI